MIMNVYRKTKPIVKPMEFDINIDCGNGVGSQK